MLIKITQFTPIWSFCSNLFSFFSTIHNNGMGSILYLIFTMNYREKRYIFVSLSACSSGQIMVSQKTTQIQSGGNDMENSPSLRSRQHPLLHRYPFNDASRFFQQQTVSTLFSRQEILSFDLRKTSKTLLTYIHILFTLFNMKSKFHYQGHITAKLSKDNLSSIYHYQPCRCFSSFCFNFCLENRPKTEQSGGADSSQ